MTTYIATYDSIVSIAVANIREQKGITQADLAEAVGVSPSTWSRIESGQTGLSLDQLKKASDRLGFKPHEVLQISDMLIEKVPDVEVASKKDIETAVKAAGIAGKAMGIAGVAAASFAVPLSGPILGAALGVGLTALIAEFTRDKSTKSSKSETKPSKSA